jgi:hypothetical protein
MIFALTTIEVWLGNPHHRIRVLRQGPNNRSTCRLMDDQSSINASIKVMADLHLHVFCLVPTGPGKIWITHFRHHQNYSQGGCFLLVNA